GFTRVAEIVRYEALTRPDGNGGGTPYGPLPNRPGGRDFDRLWDWLVPANLRPLTRGVEVAGGAAPALSPAPPRRHLPAGPGARGGAISPRAASGRWRGGIPFRRWLLLSRSPPTTKGPPGWRCATPTAWRMALGGSRSPCARWPTHRAARLLDSGCPTC